MSHPGRGRIVGCSFARSVFEKKIGHTNISANPHIFDITSVCEINKLITSMISIPQTVGPKKPFCTSQLACRFCQYGARVGGVCGYRFSGLPPESSLAFVLMSCEEPELM